MAILSCIYNSAVLGEKTALNAVLPENAENPQELAVFTLLHGLDGNYLSWCTNTRIQALAEKLGVAVIMPEAKNSFYCKGADGKDYYTHIAHEVPRVAQRLFNLSVAPRQNHIAGISMGGFGALKIGLLNPERYATVGSLSSVIDIAAQYRDAENLSARKLTALQNAFGDGDSIAGGENDILHLASLAAGGVHPTVYQFCGTEDFLYEDNRLFLSRAKAMGLKVDYCEAPGEHLWTVWAEQIWDYIPWALRKGAEMF